ncbi:MAG: hypothetical protein HUU06_00260 [Planctomycetaceae bacterium]|nr:hypothetical protein [Planctomycetota bacterium]NUN51208.1 hypothetical protein [Planctomycetaceae bacterium]
MAEGTHPARKSPSPLGASLALAAPPAPRSALPDPGPPVSPGYRAGTQKDLTRTLYEDLGDVVNRHRPSPETLLMALELLRLAALDPRRRQMELEE